MTRFALIGGTPDGAALVFFPPVRPCLLHMLVLPSTLDDAFRPLPWWLKLLHWAARFMPWRLAQRIHNKCEAYVWIEPETPLLVTSINWHGVELLATDGVPWQLFTEVAVTGFDFDSVGRHHFRPQDPPIRVTFNREPRGRLVGAFRVRLVGP